MVIRPCRTLSSPQWLSRARRAEGGEKLTVRTQEPHLRYGGSSFYRLWSLGVEDCPIHTGVYKDSHQNQGLCTLSPSVMCSNQKNAIGVSLPCYPLSQSTIIYMSRIHLPLSNRDLPPKPDFEDPVLSPRP